MNDRLTLVPLCASESFIMIVPRIGEDSWSKYLQHVSIWQPSDAPMLVVAPHPDDETLGAGGLIASQRAKGVDVTVVAVTDGEHAYADNNGLAATRREEQAQALARLGVSREKIIRLGLIDSSVAKQEQELVTRLLPLVTPQTHIVAPWSGDFHPDHEACARAAAAVAQKTGATLTSYFFWTWHRGTTASLDGLQLQKFCLDDAAMQARRDALACHTSQLQHAPEPEILPENLLWPARLSFEVFAR
jgi:LmbE family N-acetylglucosaminyl deacetylase